MLETRACASDKHSLITVSRMTGVDGLHKRARNAELKSDPEKIGADESRLAKAVRSGINWLFNDR